MRYELTDYELAAISPMLPNKPRARLLAHVLMTLPRGCARPRPGYAPAIASCSFA